MLCVGEDPKTLTPSVLKSIPKWNTCTVCLLLLVYTYYGGHMYVIKILLVSKSEIYTSAEVQRQHHWLFGEH